MKITRRKWLSGGAPALAAAALTSATGASPARESQTAPPHPGPEWPSRRKEIERAWLDLLGDFPREIPPLRAEMKKVARESGVDRYHVSFQAEPDDRVTAWLLVPDRARKRPVPGIVCLHSTTFGSGKDSTIGLAGMRPEDPPEQWIAGYRNPEVGQAYGRDLAEHGYVTLSIDLLNDGERITGVRKGDSRAFYARHPEWSVIGKNIWDVMRSVDFLKTLEWVDGSQIGCTGWSLGGHTTLWSAAFDTRIGAAIANGGVLDWHRTGDSWSRPDKFSEENPDLTRRFGFKVAIGPSVLIKKALPYIANSSTPPPVDFDSLMMMVAPRPLMIFSTEQEFYRHNLLTKCARALDFYMNWRDVDGLPSVVDGRMQRRGYDRTVDYYQFHNKIAPEEMPGELRQLNAGDCFSWFSFPGGHSTPPAAREVMFGWFDRWLGLDTGQA